MAKNKIQMNIKKEEKIPNLKEKNDTKWYGRDSKAMLSKNLKS
jgi:hypothetical protein